ncbi:DUF1015 domain-containing protein [Actinomycetaceae bacterium MB13-C1-2]|nr:DUF1015 domain-containing protein [Actinomycetaceae bacterium MB13-C1-2]
MTFERIAFGPADILIPRDCDLTLWSVVACDQYTSEPAYWQRVNERVGSSPSTLRMILPEASLEGPNVAEDIRAINETMSQYLDDNRFVTLPDSMIYVERRLDDGRVRKGLVGVVDLQQYDYHPGSDSMVRATEGTVLERIPPRVEVRKNAPIELPHVMLLCDDPERTVIEPLESEKNQMNPVYDFDLMERGGHISGWQLNLEQLKHVSDALVSLGKPESFATRYRADGMPVIVFAVGDGNHSLATAKECYEQQKAMTPEEEWDSLPSRYALCELVNLHDDSLEFEPIHRVIFDVDFEELLADLVSAYPGAYLDESQGRDETQRQDHGHTLIYSVGAQTGTITVPNPTQQLEVGTLQTFLDSWLAKHPEARIDYVHGADVAKKLAEEPNTLAFLLPGMGKGSLFEAVIHDGVLPRKTFSMGESHDKRFYLEARRIQN